MQNIPDGFVPFPIPVPDSFMGVNGPFYFLKGERTRIGLRIEPRHCNPDGRTHGGLIGALADMILGNVIYEALGKRHPTVTISLNTDYLSVAPPGCWFDGWGEVQRLGSSLVFVRCELHADGKLAARASGVYKLLKPRTAG